MSWLARWARRLGASSRPEPARVPGLVSGLRADATGVWTQEQCIEWSDVRSVHAYKTDLLTFDQVCVVVACDEAELAFSENDDGYAAALDAMHAALPGFPPFDSWCTEVALPPFDLNDTELWHSPDAKSAPAP
ncbi:MAG: hypothetical protein AAFP86_01980 [Planctomycetota bacterium]